MFTIFMVLFLFVSCNKATEVSPAAKATDDRNTEGLRVKELDEIKKSLKGDVRVKLKKDGKGGYSWEITGKDVQEVIKANETLRKRLNE
jgi:hypothetical protein